jgi:hypothetical protein
MREIGLFLGDKALRTAFQTFAHAGGFYGYHLPNMHEVAEVAAPYYNNDLRGGEGHMEVGKLILNVVKSKATMTLSVKPFGCMPSSGVSDGVQSLITEKFPGTIYCAVETNGDGAVNFQSRIQMYLFKARQAAQEELDRALAETGLSMERVREFMKQNPRYASPLYRAPHRASTTTADLVREIATVIDKSAAERVLASAQQLAVGAGAALRSASVTVPRAARATSAFVTRASTELFGIAKEKAPEVAAQALVASRERLGRVLPFVRGSEQSVAVAAE